MRLSNIRAVGRYKNTETGKVVNIKKGTKVGYSVSVLFYLHRNKRVFITDRDFYSEPKKWEPAQ